jgi:hypothetical protein
MRASSTASRTLAGVIIVGSFLACVGEDALITDRPDDAGAAPRDDMNGRGTIDSGAETQIDSGAEGDAEGQGTIDSGAERDACVDASCGALSCGPGTKVCDGACVPTTAENGCEEVGRCVACAPSESCVGSPSKCTCVEDPKTTICAAEVCGIVVSNCGNDVDCGLTGCTAPAPICVTATTLRTFGTACNVGACDYPQTDTPCGTNKVCSSGSCLVCKSDTSCGASCTACTGATPRCKDLGATSACVECLNAADCSLSGYCNPSTNTCDYCLPTSVVESESNDTVGTADTMPGGSDTYCGVISSISDVDYVTFTLPADAVAMTYRYYSPVSLDVAISIDGGPFGYVISPFSPGKPHVFRISGATANTPYRLKLDITR